MNEPTRSDPVTEAEERRSVDKNTEEALQPAADPDFEDETGSGAGSDVRQES